MAWDFNPNGASRIAGLEVRPLTQRSQRVGSAYEQLIHRFRSQAAGVFDQVSLYGDVGSGVAATPGGPSNKLYAGETAGNLPGGLSAGLPSAGLVVDLCTRTNELSTSAVTVDTYPVSALATPGTQSWRNAADSANAVVADVSTADAAYAQTTAANGGGGAMALSFQSDAFGLTVRHVIGVEFEIISKGAIHVGTQRLGGTVWYGEPNPVVFSSANLQSNVFRIGETFIERRSSSEPRLTHWTPERVRAFQSGGTRRLRIGSDSSTPGSQIDYVVMRVYSITERRHAVGLWEPKLGFKVLTPSAVGGFTSLGTPQGLMRLTTKSLTSNVATVGTAVDHGRSVGDTVIVSNIGDGIFDGTYTITAVTANTVSYARTAANVAQGTAVNGQASFLSPLASASDYSLIVRRPVAGSTGLPLATGRLRLLTKPGVKPLNYGIRLADTVSAGGQPATVTAADEDAVMPLMAQDGVGDRGESMPYRQFNPVFSGGQINIPVVSTLTYDVAYVIATADFWTEPTNVNISLDNGAPPTKQHILTAAEVHAAPVIHTSVVKNKTTGVTKTVEWHLVRLDFGSGVAISSGATARLVVSTPQGGGTSGNGPLIGGLGYATAAAGTTYSGSSTLPTAVNVDSVEHAFTTLDADAMAVIGQKPVAPTAVYASAMAGSYFGGTGPYVRFGFTPPTAPGSFAYYEVQRYDDRDPVWRTIARLTSSVASGLADHEARIGVPTQYRVRTVKTDGVEGDWAYPLEELLTADESSFETSTAGWVNVAPSGSVARSTSQAAVGAASLAVAGGNQAVADARLGAAPGRPCEPGRTYVLTGQWRAATNVRATQMMFAWYDAAGVLISTVYGSELFDTLTGWVTNSLTASAPANAASVRIGGAVGGVATGEVHYLDDVHWTRHASVTLPVPKRGRLYLTSNEQPGMGVAADDVGSSSARDYTFPEADELVRRTIYGRDLPVAFRAAGRRGIEFVRRLLVASGTCPAPRPIGPSQFDPLRDLAAAAVGYVAIRDTEGNRWMGVVTVPEGTVTLLAGAHNATIAFIETTTEPVVVADAGTLASANLLTVQQAGIEAAGSTGWERLTTTFNLYRDTLWPRTGVGHLAHDPIGVAQTMEAATVGPGAFGLPVTPGERFMATCWGRRQSTGGEAELSVAIEFLSAAGATLALHRGRRVTSTTTYQAIPEVYATAPTGSAYARMRTEVRLAPGNTGYATDDHLLVRLG